jgi:hypothetical protein
MRKSFVFVLLSILIAGCSSLPPWSPVPTGQSVVYGQIKDSRRGLTFLAFADNPGIIAITVQNLFGGSAPRYGMIVEGPARTSLREAVAKFQEWARLATDNHVEITREITTIDLAQMFRRGEGWEAQGTREVTLVFSARLEGPDTLRITLVMRTAAAFASSDQIVFTTEQAADLRRYLEDEEVDAAYAQARKKQDTVDMFK